MIWISNICLEQRKQSYDSGLTSHASGAYMQLRVVEHVGLVCTMASPTEP